MYQRRAGGSATGTGGDAPLPVVASSTTGGSAATSTTTNGFKKRRKGRRSSSTTSSVSSASDSFLSKILSPRLTLQIRQILDDEDLLITLIQAISVIILLGCGITLILHYFGTGELQADDDDGAVKASWFNTLLVNLNWIFKPTTMASKRQRMSNGLYPRMDMRPSKIYEIPESLSFVGDKSDHYAALRKEYDEMMDELPDIPQKYVFGAMPMKEPPHETLPEPYDIYNCPTHPPKNYPYAWNLLKLLNHWQPDDPAIPDDSKVFQGLCIFDYEKDYDKAVNYRKKELPFVVVNDPQVKATVKRWNSPGYMDRMLGQVRHRAEYSESNHFLYWNRPKGWKPPGQRQGRPGRPGGNRNPLHAPEAEKMKDWKEPTTMMRMTYQDWLSHANLTEGETVGPDDPHYYFRLIGCGETGPQGECDQGSSEYLFDELPYFQPKETLYIVDPLEQKGIHCRFGMHGVIAENHFDQSRNAIVVLGGERRYVLAHPNQCRYLSLLPKGHPSARHSAVDWSDPDLDSYPEFAEARGNEVVLQAGDVLYLPTNWFHYIISLSLNFQCNTRSGVTPDYMKPIRECGF